MATIETAWKKSDGPVKYHASSNEILLGDKVIVRGWFRASQGVINYVPGISSPHGEMEHDALYWVGISYPRGTFTAILVDPDSGRTLKKLEFVSRGDAAAANPLPPEPFE